MVQTPAGLYSWYEVQTTSGKAIIEIVNKDAIHANNQNYLRITSWEGQGVGVYNTGFPDTPNSVMEPTPSIHLLQGDEYTFSLFARSNEEQLIEVSLTSAEGDTVYAFDTISGISTTWKRYTCVFKPNTSSTTARLQIIMKRSGVLDIDNVSLFPKKTWKNRENGIRYDLGKMLEDMKPSFFCFPGGCLVEGRIISNRYQWKDTIGLVEHRKSTFNNWAFSGDYPYYYQSYGFGFYEYFILAKDLGAEPVPCINAGISHPAKGSFQPTVVPM